MIKKLFMTYFISYKMTRKWWQLSYPDMISVNITNVDEFPEGGTILNQYHNNVLVYSNWSRGYYENGYFDHIENIGSYTILSGP